MATNFTPLHDRVLVTRVEAKDTTKSGLYIPESGKEKPQEGKVVAVGLGRVTDKGVRVPLDICVGDSVLFGKYSGSEIKIEFEEFLILREDEILGVLA